MDKKYFAYRNKKIIGPFKDVSNLDFIEKVFNHISDKIPDSDIELNPMPPKDEIVILEYTKSWKTKTYGRFKTR